MMKFSLNVLDSPRIIDVSSYHTTLMSPVDPAQECGLKFSTPNNELLFQQSPQHDLLNSMSFCTLHTSGMVCASPFQGN